ncbi:organic hydroperoxide resistance protein [Martensiomyces pterosporus]|nr:organic hydroperoxide resistance protein [Martensiomyces pterosporus]
MTAAIARTLAARVGAQLPRTSVVAATSRRYISIKPIYTAEASATGGRNGRAVSSDKVLNVELTLPKSLGGPGEAGKTNPEQLFAAGYAACFQGAMGLAARNLKVALPESNTVTGRVHIGKDAEGGLGLAVELHVNAPGLDKETTQKVVDLAHTICPYSRATKGNIDVTLAVV